VEAVAIVRDTEVAEVLVLGIVAENSDFEVENESFDHDTAVVAVSAPGTESEKGGLGKQAAGVAAVDVEPIAAALDTSVTAPESIAAVGSFVPDTAGLADDVLTVVASSPGKLAPAGP
jgi:hypothetical protein